MGGRRQAQDLPYRPFPTKPPWPAVDAAGALRLPAIPYGPASRHGCCSACTQGVDHIACLPALHANYHASVAGTLTTDNPHNYPDKRDAKHAKMACNARATRGLAIVT